MGLPLCSTGPECPPTSPSASIKDLPIHSIKHDQDRSARDQPTSKPTVILGDIEQTKSESAWSIAFRTNYKQFCDSITPPKPHIRSDRDWKLLETALESVYGREEGQKFLREIMEKEKTEESSCPEDEEKGGVVESKGEIETELDKVGDERSLETALADVIISEEAQEDWGEQQEGGGIVESEGGIETEQPTEEVAKTGEDAKTVEIVKTEEEIKTEG